jgi:hypothetical protein
MKQVTLQATAAIFMAGILFPSCKKDNSTRLLTPEVSFGMIADGFATTLVTVNPGRAEGLTVFGPVTTTPASVTWTSGIANITSFKLEAKKAGVKTEIQSKNITNVDLFSVTPSSISATIDTGVYSEIEVKVIFSRSTTANLPLVLKGNFKTTGGALIPIEFDFNDDGVIKAQLANVIVDGSKDLRTIINMHLNTLLAGITSAEIDTATRTNSAIVISSTLNSGIYNKIVSNVTLSGDSKGFEKHEKSEREKKG